MQTRVVTPPTQLPVSVAEMRKHCYVEHAEDDLELESCIQSATARAELETGRKILTQTLELSLDRFPKVIYLPWGIVRSIVSINYTDQDGTDAELDAADYQATLDVSPCRITAAYALTWPAARTDIASVRVQYTSGWDFAQNVPSNLVRGIKMLAAYYFANRESSDVPLGCLADFACHRDEFDYAAANDVERQKLARRRRATC